jgi:hypothetical protein
MVGLGGNGFAVSVLTAYVHGDRLSQRTTP